MSPIFTIKEASQVLDISVQSIYKRVNSKGLTIPKKGKYSTIDHHLARELLGLAFKKTVASFQIVKGGTGKSTLCALTSIRASLYGAKVLAIDLDQQANLTTALGVSASRPSLLHVFDSQYEQKGLRDVIVPVLPGLDLVPSSISNALLDNHLLIHQKPLDRVYRDLINEVRDDYDLILFDCPPALSASVTAVTLACDTIFCPVAPEAFSLSGLTLSLEALKNLNKSYGTNAKPVIIVNKFEGQRTLSHDMLASLAGHSEYSSKLAPVYIRSSQAIPNAFAINESIWESFRKSNAKEDLEALTSFIAIDQQKTKTNAYSQNVDLGSLSVA